ncbi:MAG: amino acid adenylation domain protein [Acidobacteria bacterium]|nr:amino acid adenylation domain protein [Acidobacteriota bacterium]
MEPFIFPASFAQQRLWFLDLFDPGKSVYHLLYALHFDGSLNLSALELALNEVLRRHESLRTSFVMIDGEPKQAVAREMKLELPVIDLTALGRDEAEAEARRWWQIEGERPFDLAAVPLLRGHLIRLSADENVLVITMHHIITDGWSMGVFLREVSTLYGAFREGQPSPLPELPVQYADYSVWQREWMTGEVLEAQLAYWIQHLAGAPTALELATDRPRPAVQTFAGARHYTELSSELADRLRAFSRREGVTLFMTLLAAFDVLLLRYSGQDDVVVGIPLAGRGKSELESLIGLFVNTLPLRASLSGNPTFRELLQRVREAALGAYAHQEIPFDKLVEELEPERSLSHAPLFQVIFALENTPPALDHQGVALQWLEVDRGTARTDLSLFVSDKGGALSAIWEYSTDLFDGETIRGMMAAYSTLLASILQDAGEEIGYLNIWSEDERHRFLTEWNSEKSEPAAASCMHEEFETQAALTPEAIALVCGERRLTYRELNSRANQVAHHLQSHGVGPETPVGIYLGRSEELIIALLGVLKSGGAYVPLDPTYPRDRLVFMLEDARVPLLLTESKLLRGLPDLQAEIIPLDEAGRFAGESTSNPVSAVTPENLAYIIYTSGSTGRPKGVEVTHRTVVHLFSATRNQLGIRAGDIWTVVHSSAFDFSVWEIWGCLLQGGRLVLAPFEVVQSPADLFELLCDEGVTVLSQTPSALREVLGARERARQNRDWSVRLIICGGDALDQDLAIELGRLEVPVWNFYGPTESSVWTTCALITPTSVGDFVHDHQAPLETEIGDQAQTEVGATSIGRPLPDLQVYLLDPLMQPVPPGVAGELFIGGAGLARGYLRRPELTAEKFTPNPFGEKPGSRLYRTGDLARYRSKGRIEFIGRIDNQVKLRGFRVELGEIENALTDHPGVAQAVVVIREATGRDRRLVAYVVARDGTVPNAGELRNHLRSSLPDYMVPADFVLLDELPLTPNNKVDRRALPAPERSEEQTDDFLAPRTPMEELIADIWSQVLHTGPVGIYDNFFELGGHSLLATQVTSRIRQTLNIDLPVRALFECLTVGAMAERLEQMVQGEGGLQVPPIVTVPKGGNLPLSFAQQRLWFLDQLQPGSAFYNVGRALRLRGQLDVAALSESFNQIVKRHESLRTSFGSEQGTPFQRIMSHTLMEIPLLEIGALPEPQREAEARRLAAEQTSQPFDLTQGPFLRVGLIKFSTDDHVLVITMHHIAADEWSIAILFRELARLYDAITHGRPSPLSALPIQYADYAAWQRRWLHGERLEKLASYWRKQLAGTPMLLSLPTDKARPAVQSFRGAHEMFALSISLTSDLKTLSRREGVTLFMTGLAAFQLLLSRLSGQQDLLVGTDVANRNRVETEGLIGFFTNLLPLRARLANDLEFRELLHQVRETTLEAYAHQDLPFEKLVEELRPERDPSHNPIVQVLLVMQNPDSIVELTELQTAYFDLPLDSSRFDLVLFLSETEGRLEGFWLYNPDLFEPATIARFSSSYQKLLESVVADPEARLDSFDIAKDESQPTIEQQGSPEARLKRLRSVRRKGVDLAQLSSVKMGPLKPGEQLPLLIEPAADDVDLAEWAAGNREAVEQNLLRHGAILFRGFAVDSVKEFEQFAGALCPELFGEYGDLPREELGGKVYGSTPYPADETILFHNESSHMHQWPMLIWFYCVKAAQVGGESPILDCRKIYQLLDPLIREKFENKGLMYVRNFTDGLDVSWQDFFHTNDRSVVENYCRQAAIEFEWKGDRGLRTRQVGPAVVRHPQTGELVFFNQMQLHHISCLAPAVRESLLAMMDEEDLPRNVYYGDGSRIEDSVMSFLGELYEQNGVSFPWQERDVLMLNNMLVAHSRNPYVGERKIVVALGKLVSKTEIEQPQNVV